MESRHFYTYFKEFKDSSIRTWDSTELDSFLGTLDIGAIVHIQWSADLSDVIIVFMSEVVKVERKDEVGKREQREVPEDVSISSAETVIEEREKMHQLYEGSGETPLGEQIDSGTEEADQQSIDSQPELF
jgi:hypothetical protein